MIDPTGEDALLDLLGFYGWVDVLEYVSRYINEGGHAGKVGELTREAVELARREAKKDGFIKV